MTDSYKHELTELILKTFDGEISDEKLVRLRSCLLSDESAREHYQKLVSIYANLHCPTGVAFNETAQEEAENPLLRMLELDNQRADLAMVESKALQQIEAQKRIEFEVAERQSRYLEAKRRLKASQRTSRIALFSAIGSIAAMLILLANLWFGPESTTLLPVATLADQRNAVWEDEQLSDGDQLSPGVIRLKSGFARILMDNGAEVLMQGRSRLKIVAYDEVRLTRGTASAYVPPKATGFSINIPGGKVIDLGTNFGIYVGQDGRSLVDVFEGRVSLISGDDDREKNAQDLRGGRTVKLDPHTNTVMEVKRREGMFVRKWDEVRYKPYTTGMVKYLYNLPSSARADRFEGDQPYLFLERKSVKLPVDVEASITEPGVYSSREVLDSQIKVGTVVDSYMIHLDTAKELKGVKTFSMTISFDRPVLGIIHNGKRLLATDELLGNENIDYGGISHRGAGGVYKRYEDTIKLSEDMKTLSVILKVGNLDQMRIITEALESE